MTIVCDKDTITIREELTFTYIPENTLVRVKQDGWFITKGGTFKYSPSDPNRNEFTFLTSPITQTISIIIHS